MIRAEPAYSCNGTDVWYGQYCTGRFWHTVRNADGRATNFRSEAAAIKAAQIEWWGHGGSRSQKSRPAVNS